MQVWLCQIHICFGSSERKSWVLVNQKGKWQRYGPFFMSSMSLGTWGTKLDLVVKFGFSVVRSYHISGIRSVLLVKLFIFIVCQRSVIMKCLVDIFHIVRFGAGVPRF